jgi:S-adenosylhomocysteine hydrolase
LQNRSLASELAGGDDWQPDLVFDDGGDATHHLVNKCPAVVKHLKGIVESSVVGVHRLYQVIQSEQEEGPMLNTFSPKKLAKKLAFSTQLTGI